MGRTLRKTSWMDLETIFDGTKNGFDQVQNNILKWSRTFFGKFSRTFSEIWIFSIGIPNPNTKSWYFLKSREMLKIIMFCMLFSIKNCSRKIFKKCFRSFYNFCFELGQTHSSRRRKLFLNTSTRSFATYVPYAIAIFACRVNSLARFFPTFWGNLTFKGTRL